MLQIKTGAIGVMDKRTFSAVSRKKKTASPKTTPKTISDSVSGYCYSFVTSYIA